MAESIYAPSYIKEQLLARNLRMQKKFGQNFLISPAVCENIASASAETCENPAVCLEIGPGIGALTLRLSEKYDRVVCLEIDRGIFPWLSENLAERPNVTLYNEDALESDFAARLAQQKGEKLAVCANLPYSVTSPLILKLVESKLPFESLTLMVQKEAACRFAAQVGDESYGSLSAYLAYYGEVKRLFDVKEANFYPRPTVVSTVIRITPHKEKPVHPNNEALFFSVIRAAFSARRKTVYNCLTSALGRTKEEISEALETAGIDPSRRGETLGLPEFCALADALVKE
ncbi:MAG: ribosomal RNA small subunit methyltransferase A [Clostridia bacterium]|nr:ribosomal RNA small subunit methyltransferase A [Clostridia bacterium]